MTTIATDGKTIACDLQFTHGNTKFKGNSKIFEVPSEVSQEILGCKKALIGGSGNAADLGKAWAWFTNPSGRLPRIANTSFLMLSENGIYFTSDLHTYLEIKDKFYSIGSGADFARTALALGKSPLEAVKLAAKFDVMTGMGYKEYSL